MFGIEFASPYYLYLLQVVPLLIGWYVWQGRDGRHALQFSSFSLLPAERGGWLWLRHVPFILQILALCCLVVAVARPQSFSRDSSSTTEGIDIMISLDVSGSMLARDFTPDRIEAAKKIGMQFVSGRGSDRMGLVVFAHDACTMCPLTTDHATLLNQFASVEMGMLADGTAIGSGLAMAVNRLVHSDAVSRVVILLTDGVNNSGEIAPYTAAEIAQAYGIRVYVIGVGSMGTAPFPVQTPFGVRYQEMEVQIDEPSLMQIAHLTGGEYFRATDNAALEKVYERIDELEKTKIHVEEYLEKREEYLSWAWLALLFMGLALVLRHGVLRVLP